MVLHRCRRHNTFGSTRFRPAHKLLLKALGRPKGAGGGRGQALNDDGTGETEDRTMGGRRARRCCCRSRSRSRPTAAVMRSAATASVAATCARTVSRLVVGRLAPRALAGARAGGVKLRLPLGLRPTPSYGHYAAQSPYRPISADVPVPRPPGGGNVPLRAGSIRADVARCESAADVRCRRPLAGRACALAVFLPVLPKLSARALVPPPADANSPVAPDFR